MKQCTEQLKGIIYGFALFIAVYLIGAFVMTDFNISHWTEVARVLVGVMGGGCGITIALVYYGYNNETTNT